MILKRDGQGRVRDTINNNGRNSHKKSKDYQYSHTRGRGRDHDNNHSTHSKPKSVDKSKIGYYKCHKYDYYKLECQTNLNKDGGRWSNFIKKKEETLYYWSAKWKNKEMKKFIRIYGT